ncbi:protein shortage in chiasmata 1 ortholog isoform X2 [Dendropsophus ebraccatus]|uniref:protein shortage in chiasmata 1 ortholog isoform X2 n=1 Tax=Dendropsophus ebraccatus TaxID=150705 RepID=UPI003831A1FC
MNTVLFPGFKFLSLDYEYENLMMQKLATSWMLISFPKEILQEEEYCHSNNDVYRTPWKRSIPICKVHEEDSVTEVWKRYASFTHFLEKQRLFNNAKSLEIVPSSNPFSQIDPEEVCSGPELNVPEDKHSHEECWKTFLTTTLQDYLLPEDIVFIDHLKEFGRHVPRMRALLSRLKTFPIQDPLVDWQKNFPAEETLFRLNTSIEKNLEPNMFLEDIHMLPSSTEEHCLSQPCTLEVNKHSTQCGSSLSELITVLKLAPEEMSEEEGKTNIAGLSTKIYCKDNSIEQFTVQRNLNPCKEEDAEKDVSFRSHYDYEIEVPITPPHLKPKDRINKNYIHLIAEELSPFSTRFHITDAVKDILESQGSHCAVKLLLLKVPPLNEKSEHPTIEELKVRLSINPEASIILNLKEDWGKLGLNMKDPDIIEKLKIDIPNTENLNANENESFKELNGILEEKNSPTYYFSPSMINLPSSQNTVICMDTFNNADTTTEYIKVVTHEDKTDQPKVCLPLFQDENQYLTPVTLPVNCVSQASSSHQQSCNTEIIVDGPLCWHTQAKEDSDLLSSFIDLRTKSSSGYSERKHGENVLCQASQGQSYRILQAAAEPVLNTLVCLEVLECMEWNFASVPFDCTRFLLRKQMKISSNSGKLGNKHDKDRIIFKNAALLHILVTLRDLVLMCSLEATLDYLNKAKQEYQSILGPYLDGVWRMLRIIQFVRDKAEEQNPKITALLNWMEKTNKKYEHYKVLMLTQTNIKTIEDTLNNIYIKAGGLRAVGLCPANGNTFLKTEDVLNSLKSYSCVISNNQYLGNCFPWAHFSLVVEYDCTDYWLQLCQNLNVSHMTLKTSVPHNLLLETTKHPHPRNIHLLGMHVPYVLLSSEHFNHLELLNILESRYNITFIERNCNTSLQLFGKKSHCAIITVDVSTVIIIQELEEIMHNKSAETLILKLVALSLQYSCCWVLLYDKKGYQSEYSLSGDILHGVCLIYAAIIVLTSKSKDVEIKVLISSGVDETGSLIHQILDYTLMLSKSDPYKWLERSWFSLLVTKEEKILLSFPCNNPMVSCLLLNRGYSLQWLLSASLDQLKKQFPEVPSKVVKHFTDITAIHQLSLSSRLSQPPTGMEPTAAIQEPFTIHIQPVSNKILQPDILLSEIRTTKSNNPSSTFPVQRYQNKDNVSEPLLLSAIHSLQCYRRSTMFDTFSNPLQKLAKSENVLEQALHKSACLEGSTVDGPLSSGQHSSLHRVCYHPNTEQEPNFSINQERFYADISSEWNSTNPSYCGNELRNSICVSQPLPPETRRGPLKQTQWKFHSYPDTDIGNKESDSSKKGIIGKRRLTVNSIMTNEGMSAETSITEQFQQKRKKLTYERVPGRCDGQTRLRFF